MALSLERLAELLAVAARSGGAPKRQLSPEVARDAADLAEEVDKQVQRIRSAKGRLNAARSTVLARELERLMAATERR